MPVLGPTLTDTSAGCEATVSNAVLQTGHIRTENPCCARGHSSDRKGNCIKGQRTRTHREKTHRVCLAA